MKSILTFWLLGTAMLLAAPLKILVIGDSQSEEYAFEFPFSAPDSDPLNANTQNWVETLAAQRSNDVSFGKYESSPSYPDARIAGYEFNWSIPGAETETWANIVTSGLTDAGFTTRLNMSLQLSGVDATVIILGGNDANGDYRALQNNAPPTGWQSGIITNLTTIIDFVQDFSNKPILLANIPDVGATTTVRKKFPDAQKRAIATEYITQANTAIAALASAKGASLIDFFAITETLTQEGAIRIGEVEFVPQPDSENRARFLLCKDGFHPATSTQCLIANLVLEGLSLSPMTDEKILQDVLGISPQADAAYLSWVGSETTDNSFFADPDGDGLPNLGEYALAGNPIQAGSPLFTYQAEESRKSFVQTRPMMSTDLRTWIPADGVTVAADGNITVNSSQPFLRLEFDLR